MPPEPVLRVPTLDCAYPDINILISSMYVPMCPLRRRRTTEIASQSLWALVVAALMSGAAPTAGAQTAAYNTDEGRPARVEDAAAIPRYALAASVTPSWTSFRGDADGRWSITPVLAYGLVPRTQVELAIPLGQFDAQNENRIGAAGVRLAAQYSLNVETRTLPMVAVQGAMLFPVGGIGVANGHPSLKALATRTYDWGRLHFNTEATFGDEPAASATIAPRMADVSRWTTGVAVDRAFQRRGFLLMAEGYARKPIEDLADVRWHLGMAARYLVTARLTLDAGITRDVTDAAGLWMISVGARRVTAVHNMLPGLGVWRGR